MSNVAVVAEKGRKDQTRQGQMRERKEVPMYKGRELGADNHPRARWGKTAKDNASGASRRNYENKQSRALWSKDSKASIANFPWNSCNGKKNRTVITGRGNERVTFSYKPGTK
jgi:hypothetical protein